MPNEVGVKKSSAQAYRVLLRMVKSNGRQTLNDLTSKFNEHTHTIFQNCKEKIIKEGFKWRRISKVTTISKANRDTNV